MQMDSKIQAIRNFLQKHSLHSADTWIEGFIEWFLSEHNGQWSDQTAFTTVKDQWTLADLRQIGCGCLPPNLGSHMVFTLPGKYAVQVEWVKNIGQPAYSQLQQVRKVSIENVEATKQHQQVWEPKSTRMLQLGLCDGIQEVLAIEYQPLRTINEHLIPGSKILIVGPVMCRRGVILLKEQNVKLLGGEVDSLIVPNALENVLARTLNLAENPNPTILENYEPAEQTVDNEAVDTVQRNPINHHIANQHTAAHIIANQHTTARSNCQQSRNQPPCPSKVAPVMQRRKTTDFPDDDELLEFELEAQVAALEQNLTSANRVGTNSSNAPSILQNTACVHNRSDETILSDDEDGLLMQLSVDELEEKTFSDLKSVVQKRNNVNDTIKQFGKILGSNLATGNTNASKKLKTEFHTYNHANLPTNQQHVSKPVLPFKGITAKPNSSFNQNRVKVNNTQVSVPNVGQKKQNSINSCVISSTQSKITSFLKRDNQTLEQTSKLESRHVEPSISIVPYVVPQSPFVYISQLLSLSLTSEVEYVVKGFIITLTSKLQVKDEKWDLVAKINDGSGVLEVSFSEEVLEDIVGFSVPELQVMRKKVSGNPIFKEKIVNGFQQAKNKLISLNCFFHIKISPGETQPVVTQLTDISNRHKRDLENRIHQAKSK